MEANFEMLHGVDFGKGCYVGQELTARMKLRGGLRKRVLPVTGSAPLPSAGAPVTDAASFRLIKKHRCQLADRMTSLSPGR